MMKKIKIIREEERDGFHYQSDCAVIVRIFAEHGYEITEAEARELWEMNSEMVCAGWLYLPSLGDDQADDEAIWAECRPYWEEIKV